MAPLTRAAGAARSNGAFSFAQAPQPASSNEPDVIEIDDDDDEEETDDQEEEASDEEVDDDEDEMVEDEDEGGEDEEDDEEPDEGSDEETDGLDVTYEDPKAKLRNSRQDVRVSTPDLFTSAGVQQALHPLRRTADRVTRQIEAFAEKLDRFKQQEHRPNDISTFQAAYQLVKSYQFIAEGQIQEISRQNTLKRAKSGWKSSRDSQDGIGGPKTEEELKRLQLEADTWDLLLNFLSVDDPATRAHSTTAQETAFQNLHRYSTDREVWEQFLSADRFASECVIVMKWLEQTARASSDDIDSLIADLEAQAERGQGLWAHGWLYTKETIKGQKRLRAWPQPLEPDDPGLVRSLLGSESRQPLVTQLDPDAITRQKHGLEKQDQFFERATWLTCWKMLREGQSWSKIREWSQERLESWRAVSLCGSSIDTQSKTSQEDDGMTRMMNCRSHESWRTACSALAQNPNTEDFERAVYALLAGETEPAYKVCQSWDDYLYVFYNHILLSRYQGFCKQFQRKLNHPTNSSLAFLPEPEAYNEVRKFLETVKDHEQISVEARNPYRTVQSAILCKDYDSFFVSFANAVSKVATTSESDLVPDLSPTHVDDSALIAAKDQDSLRIATHLYVIAKSLGYARTDSHFSQTASVTLIGYIDLLQKAHLVELIPSYASLLPDALAHSVLARVLIDIVDPRERKMQARLMHKHKIDMKTVLRTQWDFVLSDALQQKDVKSTIRLATSVRGGDGYKELAPVKKNFVGEYVSPEDERTIRCLEWHRYLEDQWQRICQLGTLLYKRFCGTYSICLRTANVH
ncbi:Nucleoporin nup84 [Paecilomyces lecythidis]|uniref:Nuclear pore complex protein n=1 Tax=Paecilomyces lecythidis TaxID=3004212 RepID=A0ABR3YBC9_9EURO